MSWKATAWAKDTRGHRNGSQKLVLMVLADYHNTELGCYPSHKTLAADCEMTTRSIIRHLQTLADDDFISITREGHHRHNRYTLNFTRGDNLSGDTGDHSGVTSVHSRTSIEPSAPPSGPSDSSDSLESSESLVPTGGAPLPKRTVTKIDLPFLEAMRVEYPSLQVDDEMASALSRNNYAKTSDKQKYVRLWLERSKKFQAEERAPPGSAAPPRDKQSLSAHEESVRRRKGGR